MVERKTSCTTGTFTNIMLSLCSFKYKHFRIWYTLFVRSYVRMYLLTGSEITGSHFYLIFCVLEYIPFFLISETWETWLLLLKEKEKGEAIAADIPSR